MLSLSISLSLLATPAAPLQDWALLDASSRRAFNYFVDQSHPITGYTKDRSRNFTADSKDHFVASVAAIGFALSAYAVGEHRGWITKAKALELSRKTLRHLYYKAPQSHGWY
ncbi:MAG TPA: hypothetical protein VK171_12605, partial [Fimbriimonas sp.]|nr:hypothetical protein [Fimbriimonas sp.]